jgi:hypothetical protein
VLYVSSREENKCLQGLWHNDTEAYRLHGENGLLGDFGEGMLAVAGFS